MVYKMVSTFIRGHCPLLYAEIEKSDIPPETPDSDLDNIVNSILMPRGFRKIECTENIWKSLLEAESFLST